MSKIKTAFFCSSCGYESAKWLGRCPSCNQWNTFVEEVIVRSDKEKKYWQQPGANNGTAKAKPLSAIQSTHEQRLITTDNELNRVLGGGIVAGSIILASGEPGIGKSTLLLQDVLQLKNTTTLYISGEESEQQVKMRAERLMKDKYVENVYLLAETSLSVIFSEVQKLQPHLLVIDSIQTLHSDNIDAAPGSISQIKECAASLQRFAKETNTPVFLIGHITKTAALPALKY